MCQTFDRTQDFFFSLQTKTNRNLHDVHFWQNKTKFGLTDTDVPFLKFQKLNSERLSVLHKAMLDIDFKKEDK